MLTRTEGAAGLRVQGVELDDGRGVQATWVVLAAGCWSGGIEGLPASAVPPVRPVKGQILTLRQPPGDAAVTGNVRGMVHGRSPSTWCPGPTAASCAAPRSRSRAGTRGHRRRRHELLHERAGPRAGPRRRRAGGRGRACGRGRPTTCRSSAGPRSTGWWWRQATTATASCSRRSRPTPWPPPWPARSCRPRSRRATDRFASARHHAHPAPPPPPTFLRRPEGERP